MPFLTRALTFTAIVVVMVLQFPAERAEAPPGYPWGSQAPGSQLEGLARPLGAVRTIARAVWLDEQERARVAREQAQERLGRGSGTSTAGERETATQGSCGGMIPPGFPEYIVRRESRGKCGAVNPASGTFGPVQLDPRHFSPHGWGTGSPGQCVGLSYGACVARLWDGGDGAEHWSTG